MIETKRYSDGITATGKAPLPDLSPRQQDLNTAMQDLNDIESVLGGKNGSSIRLRGFINKVANENDALHKEVDDLHSLIAVFQSGNMPNVKLRGRAL